jgi:hypothetical protein
LHKTILLLGAVVVVIVGLLDLQLPVQSVHITTKRTLCDRLSVACGRSVIFFDFLHQQNWPPWYNWNIIEISFKHPNPILLLLVNFRFDLYIHDKIYYQSKCFIRKIIVDFYIYYLWLILREWISHNQLWQVSKTYQREYVYQWFVNVVLEILEINDNFSYETFWLIIDFVVYVKIKTKIN